MAERDPRTRLRKVRDEIRHCEEARNHWKKNWLGNANNVDRMKSITGYSFVTVGRRRLSSTQRSIDLHRLLSPRSSFVCSRAMSSGPGNKAHRPAARVEGQKADVWLVCFDEQAGSHTKECSRTIVNEAATASPVQPIINMGQGFL